jgi:hypothetical protein
MISRLTAFSLKILLILIGIVTAMSIYAKTLRYTVIGAYYLAVLHAFLILLTITLISVAFFLGIDFITNSDFLGENHI